MMLIAYLLYLVLFIMCLNLESSESQLRDEDLCTSNIFGSRPRNHNEW